MKKLFVMLIMMLFFAPIACATDYGYDYFLDNFQYMGGNTKQNPIYLYMKGPVGYYYLNPTTAPDPCSEGHFYYDSTADAIKLYTGAAWVALATAAGNSLDLSYDAGVGITVDNGAVTLTATNAANNVALAIVQSDTGTAKGMTITNAGTGVTLDIQNAQAGTDIQGTDDTWSVSTAGLITGVGFTCTGEIQTTADVLLNGTYDVAWDVDRNLLIAQDNAYIGFGGAHDAAADVTMSWNATNLLIEASVEDAGTGAIMLGSTNSMDLIIYGATTSDIARFDASAGILLMDSYPIALGDGDALLFGDTLGTGDFTISDQGDILTIDAISDGTGAVSFGNDGDDLPVKWYGDTSGGYFYFINDQLRCEKATIAFGDTDKLLFGDTLGTGAFSIESTSGVLNVTQVAADTGTITWGADNVGIDQTWYGESASAYMKWDGTTADQLKIVGVDSSGTLLAITGVDTTVDSDTVTIAHSGAGAGIKITNGSADSVSLRSIATAAQTTSSVIVECTTNNANLADDVGMVDISSDSALAHTGATLLRVANGTGQPLSAAEGFLARFVDNSTAQTNACAVEIETTNTTPALKLNNQLQITGANSAGVLALITGINTTGNSDTVQIVHSGTGDALQVTCTTATSDALRLVGAVAQTTSIAVIDGATGADWQGADGIGMVSLLNDGTAAHANASLLRIAQSGTSASGQTGICAYLADTTTSGGGTPYVLYLSSTNNEAIHVASGKVQVDESLVATTGLQTGVAQTLTANSDDGAGSTVVYPATVVNVTARNAGANDWILLPNDPAIGTVVKVLANAGGNFEIRTLAAGNDFINNVDCSTGAVEFLATDTSMIIFTCVKADNWAAVEYPLAGGVSAAQTPN